MKPILSTPKKRLRIPIIIGILSLLVVSLLSISVYVGWSLTHPDPDKIVERPEQYDLTYESVQFRSQHDDITLRGWWIPSQQNRQPLVSEKTVIFAHGYNDTRDMYKIKVLGLAKELTAAGYNVLLFDFRNSGESEGELTTVGQHELYDLLAAIDFAKKSKQSEHIGLLGWSMGASTSILAAVQSPDVKAVVADSPFADLSEYLAENLPVWSGLPNFPFTPIIMNTIPYIVGANPQAVSPYKAVSSLQDQKLMLIHSKDDHSVPHTNSERIKEAAPQHAQVELWITEKAGHVRTYELEKEEYERRVLAFFQQHL